MAAKTVVANCLLRAFMQLYCVFILKGGIHVCVPHTVARLVGKILCHVLVRDVTFRTANRPVTATLLADVERPHDMTVDASLGLLGEICVCFGDNWQKRREPEYRAKDNRNG